MPKVSERRFNTVEEFNAALEGLRISNANIKLARICMVDGEEIKETAEKAEKTPQALNTVIRRIWANRK